MKPIDISPPIAAEMIASSMNGSSVIHLEAPTRRMMLVSLRRWLAATWIVLPISRIDAMSTTSAITIENFRAPSMSESSALIVLIWLLTLSTPGTRSYVAANFR